VTHGSTTTTTTFTYEGLTLLSLEAAASDGTTETVTYLSDASGRPYGGLYSSSESSPVAFGIVTTDRGDVVELTDSQGEPFAFYAYDAYGTPTATESRATTGAPDAQTASAIAGASVFRYASYCYDEHSGLYYLSQRYYDPATASFITKDPAKADGEESAYQYCGGDPVGNVDPSGEAVEVTGWPAAGQAGFTQEGSTCFYYALKAMLYQAKKGTQRISTLMGRFSNNVWSKGLREWNREQLKKHYGLQSKWGSSLSWTTLTGEIRANRPVLATGSVIRKGVRKSHAWGITAYASNPRRVRIWSWGKKSALIRWDALNAPTGVKTLNDIFTWDGGRAWYQFKK
jgi:RHS repeat-associated protein